MLSTSFGTSVPIPTGSASPFTLRDVHDDGITFATRGEHTVTLQPLEFMRRFLLHVLPKGFAKIRHYGLLASAAKGQHAQVAEALGQVSIAGRVPVGDPTVEVEETDDGSHSPVLESDPRTLICAALGLFICPACRTGVLTIFTDGPDPPR